MNKVRILGIILLILGVSLFLIYDNNGIDFAFGFLSALGLVLAISGTFKNNSPKKI
ncbi:MULTISPECIES: hypothetical protein [Flavobacteriaceae]|uniref:Uncharacterized protein n=1 Tax=Lutibacter litoralis TaxID=321268 RepID=A0ABV5JZY0_9FLAO|nr:MULTISPECIES: hypothetical protein [Flavobacteriaceae]